MAERTILVTGASGFVGTHLIRRAVAEGDHVIAIDLKKPREVHENVEYITMDVADLGDFVPSRPVDTIFNFAAVHTTPGHPFHEYYQTNVMGALGATEFAEKNDVKEIVFTSSISVYGPSEEMKTEESEPKPESAYGYSKLLAENIHRAWHRRHPETKLVIVRPAVVFGPGEGGNFTRLAGLMKKGFFIYPGRKDTIKSKIYVSDLLDAIALARGDENRYVLFNACYPERYTLEQIVSTLNRRHFPGAKTYMVPRPVVMTAAKGLGAAGFLNIGIHPERVLKLVRSTDIYPGWLVSKGFRFPAALDDIMDRWANDTNRTFV